MKYKMSLLTLFFLSNCTHNLISYVKTPTSPPLLTTEQMFLRSGLINPIISDKKTLTVNSNYPTGTLNPPYQELKQEFNTLRVPLNAPFEVTVDTKNYLVASPFYSSKGLIYQASQSKPKQGKFTFTTSVDSGVIKIRIYSPKGTLQRESIWYIESKNTNN